MTEGAAMTRSESLERVLSILELGDDVKTYLKGQGINSIGKLIKVTDAVIDRLQRDSNDVVSLMDCDQVKQFKRWYAKYCKENTGAPIDWATAFTVEVWDMVVSDDISTVEEDKTTGTANIVQGTEATRVRRSLKDYPKFTKGYLGWRKHADKFEAVSVTQKIDYLIQENCIEPTIGESGYEKYKEDNAFLHPPCGSD